MVVAAWAFQHRLIYLPYGQAPAAEQVLPDAHDVAFETEDGVRLSGYWVPPADGPAVLVFNGNAGNRSLRAPLAEALGREGLGVLLFDYRGFDGQEGRPSEEGLAADARAAHDWVAARDEVDRIVYLGESLGAAVASRLAVDRPPAALVLRSPFTSLADVGRVHYPILPVRALLRDDYRVTELVERVEAPVLVVAGSEDGIVPPAQSRAVADAADARFVMIDGADHNDRALLDGERLVAEISAMARADD